MSTQPIGIQLYTLRQPLAQDFTGTLDALRDLGLRDLELAGEYGGLDAPALRGALDERGLAARAAHLPLDRLEADPAGQAAFLHALGARHAVYPYHRAESEADWRALAGRLERLAGQLAREGITLSYHNHAHELSQTFGGQSALDLLAEAAPSLALELDLAWVHAGGHDPLVYLRRYAGRTPLLHLKDVRRTEKGWQTVELGAGELDLPTLLAAVPAGTLVFYEQDDNQGLPSVRQSLAYLEGLSLHAALNDRQT